MSVLNLRSVLEMRKQKTAITELDNNKHSEHLMTPQVCHLCDANISCTLEEQNRQISNNKKNAYAFTM